MAIYYSLNSINNKLQQQQQQRQLSGEPSSLSTNLNILLLDLCTLKEDKLATILSDYNFTPKVVAVLSLAGEQNSMINNDGNRNGNFNDNNVVHQLGQRFKNQFLNLLGDYNPFVYSFHQSSKNEKQHFFLTNNENNVADFDMKKNHQMLTSRMIIDLCVRMKWTTINIVYSNEFIRNYFQFEANKMNICMDKTIQITVKDIGRSMFANEWQSFTQTLDTNIIILLTNTDINEFLIKYSSKYILDRFIWIGDKYLKTAATNSLKNYRKTIEYGIVLKRYQKDHSIDQEMTVALDDLSKYFNINNQRLGNKMINDWLHEYWQRKFHCSPYTQKHDSKCFDSKYARKAMLNIKEIKRLMDFSKTLSTSIIKFVTNKCLNVTVNQQQQFDELCLYNFHLRNELKQNIIEDLSNNNYFLNDYKPINSDNHYELEILSNQAKKINLFNSFNWSNISDFLSTNINGHSHFINCRTSCNYCTLQLSQSKNKSVNMLFSGKFFFSYSIYDTEYFYICIFI